MVAHIAGRQGHALQEGQLAGTVAGFFLQLAVGRLAPVLAVLIGPLGQGQQIFLDAGAVFPDQQHRILVQHRHAHDTGQGRRTQAFVGSLLAVGEAEMHLFDAEQAALRHQAGIQNTRLLFVHGGSCVRSLFMIFTPPRCGFSSATRRAGLHFL